MLFNLLPLGPLDGHYILPHLLPIQLAQRYRYYNAKFGHYGLLGLMMLSFVGVPVFSSLQALGTRLLRLITFV